MRKQELERFKVWKKNNLSKYHRHALILGGLLIGAVVGTVGEPTIGSSVAFLSLIASLIFVRNVLNGWKIQYNSELTVAAKKARKALDGYQEAERMIIQCRDSALRINHVDILEKVYDHLDLLPHVALEFTQLDSAHGETSSDFQKEECSQIIKAISATLHKLEKHYLDQNQTLENALKEVESKPSWILASIPNSSNLAAELGLQENENLEAPIPISNTTHSGVLPLKQKNA